MMVRHQTFIFGQMESSSRTLQGHTFMLFMNTVYYCCIYNNILDIYLVLSTKYLPANN